MTTTPLDQVAVTQTKRGSLAGRYFRRPLGVIALLLFVVVLVIAIFAPLLAPHDPNLVDFALTKAPPGPGHLLGGDSAGRDILSRLIYGARTTLYGAFITCLTGLVLGTPAGVAAGYFGGTLDRILMWISDALQSVPAMIVLLIVAAGTGSNFTVLMVAIGIFLAPGYFRISRTLAQSVRQEAYIDAARVAGLKTPRILGTHVSPAVYAPIIIQTALTAGIAMGMQAGLQFLGIGAASTPSWGAMMNDGFSNMLSHPNILLWPSLALGLTIASLALVGSTLADLVGVPTVPTRKKRRWAVPVRRDGDAAPAPTPAATVVGGVTPSKAAEACESALRIENLRVAYPGADGDTEVVHGVSLEAAPGEVLGIVGESGSGKSQTIFAALDLLPAGGMASSDGIWINGTQVGSLSRRKRHAMFGSGVGYVPQEPMTNLDPCYTIAHQLMEPLRVVSGLSRKEARERARDTLARVGISDPDRVLASYPHQISGGMAQRVLIAGAVICRPTLLVADEPTTALDVLVQAEVLELLRELKDEYGMALVMVTHNFGVVADICDRVVVMKDGRVVEEGPVDRIFANPADPYTAELISASLDDTDSRERIDGARTESERTFA
ncbi:dipeptide/oligopeptide/nickel ABC transporter permease/ATP-binding protein [Speluncibacter jeojiensis]|uniref:Dipeptide/oligopeptide/nickel ABC transporter permease/ATP-binding protein n=1 Tax=Speluncibacter jeojiensis TaxID=2710754 RepID=A0A9X4M4S0_9ACTN|nr:dipeptide/oligopeptide/nickel ABC transporter permease/ATP-binding protein [Corynebacteriales bacterium D3-21]